MKLIIIYKKEEEKEALEIQKNFNYFNKLAKKNYIIEIQEEKENA